MAYDLLWKASDVLVRNEEPMIKVLGVARRRYMSSVILTEKKKKKFPIAFVLSRSQCMYLRTLEKTIFFTHSTDSNANLIRKQ